MAQAAEVSHDWCWQLPGLMDIFKHSLGIMRRSDTVSYKRAKCEAHGEGCPGAGKASVLACIS